MRQPAVNLMNKPRHFTSLYDALKQVESDLRIYGVAAVPKVKNCAWIVEHPVNLKRKTTMINPFDEMVKAMTGSNHALKIGAKVRIKRADEWQRADGFLPGMLARVDDLDNPDGPNDPCVYVLDAATLRDGAWFEPCDLEVLK